jgi:hypothetical protein
MSDDKTKYCQQCGTKIDVDAKVCPNCGSNQPEYKVRKDHKQQPPRFTAAETKPWHKKTKYRVALVILALFIVGGIFSEPSENPPDESGTTIYKWVEVEEWTFGKNTFNLYFENDLETFTIPEDTEEWRVHIQWWDGSKDSYIKILAWRWGETDDYKIKEFYKDSKQGEGYLETTDTNGPKYYLEISAVHDLQFKLTVEAKVPE